MFLLSRTGKREKRVAGVVIALMVNPSRGGGAGRRAWLSLMNVANLEISVGGQSLPAGNYFLGQVSFSDRISHCRRKSRTDMHSHLLSFAH